MSQVTFTLRGDQIARYDYYYGNGNGNSRVVTIEGVETLGSAKDVFTIVVDQTNGASEFHNGQFISIYDAAGNPVTVRTNVQPDMEQGLAGGDEHLLIPGANLYIDIGGITEGTVKLNHSDEKGDNKLGDNDGELDFADAAAAGQVFVCFTPGTQIATAEGPRAVETLAPGAQVLTAEGPLPLLWRASRTLTFDAADETAERPIEISEGALGGGLPRRALIVSPQHRLRLEGAAVEAATGHNAVLAPAKGLTGLPGIRRMRGKRQVTYVSLLLERHSVIFAEGAATESLYPGRWALRTFDGPEKASLLACVPQMKDDPDAGYGASALPLVSVPEAKAIVAAMGRQRAADRDAA